MFLYNPRYIYSPRPTVIYHEKKKKINCIFIRFWWYTYKQGKGAGLLSHTNTHIHTHTFIWITGKKKWIIKRNTCVIYAQNLWSMLAPVIYAQNSLSVLFIPFLNHLSYSSVIVFFSPSPPLSWKFVFPSIITGSQELGNL